MGVKKLLFKAFVGGYWNVAYRKKGEESFIPLINQKNSWHADPFIYERDNELYLFTEIYDCKKDIGKISCSKIIYGENRYFDEKIIIDYKTHLSFPYVFKYNNKLYLLIESSQSRELPLFDISSDPYCPVFVRNIFEGIDFVDCCLLEKEKNVFLFGYSEEKKAGLYCFLDKDFKAISDIQYMDKSLKTRPAGGFCDFGRPAQNNEKKYGESIVFYDYLFNGNNYTETINSKDIKVDKIKFIDGTKICAKKVHTYNSTENFEVIDFFVEKIDIFRWFKMCRRKMHKKTKGIK